MNCETVQTSLADDLGNRAEETVAAHLESCEECRRICDELLELEELSRSLSGRFKVPSSFKEGVLARAAQEKPRRISRLRLVIACTVLMALAMGLVHRWNRLDAEVKPEVLMEDMGLWSLPGEFPPGTRYVEIVVDDPEQGELILRLPSVIKIHRTDLQEDFYISNVSH